MADEPNRPALNPPRRVETRNLLAVRTHDLSLVIGNHAQLLVERNLRQRRTEVPHCAIDRLNRNLANVAGVDDAPLAVGSGALVTDCAYVA